MTTKQVTVTKYISCDCRDVRRFIYWMAAATLTATVTY